MKSKELFAAANSGKGFANFYDKVFEREEIVRRYLIKGGPGTGKSTLMRKIASKALADGLDVELYRCSSDPDSLDGLLISGRIAVMDATSPHSVEAKIAGARDELVDLGAFWDAEGLAEKKEEIQRLTREKSDCYAGAYAYLEGAMVLDDRSRALGKRLLDNKKMKKAVGRIAKKMKTSGESKMTVGMLNSIGMKGRHRLDTYESLANTVYYIEDFFMTGSAFLAELIEQMMIKGSSISISYDPLNPTHPDGAFFEEDKTAFVICDKNTDRKDAHYINMKRFVNCGALTGEKESFLRIKKEYRTNRRICDGLVTAAVWELQEAGKYHFELEEIYKKYMNFERETDFFEKITENIVREAEKLVKN